MMRTRMPHRATTTQPRRNWSSTGFQPVSSIPGHGLETRATRMFIPTEIRESEIFGKGLFARESVPAGRIICFFPIGASVITEAEYLSAIQTGHHPIIRTGTRYAGQYFTHGNEEEPYTFLNHSFAPNLLCHCGIVLARQAISAGEELTLDYRTLVDDTDIGIYSDAATGFCGAGPGAGIYAFDRAEATHQLCARTGASARDLDS